LPAELEETLKNELIGDSEYATSDDEEEIKKFKEDKKDNLSFEYPKKY